MNDSSRSDLLRLASLATFGIGLTDAAPQQQAPTARSVAGMEFEKKDDGRIGVIGVGGRGNSLIDNFTAMREVQVSALCDTVKDKVLKAQAKIERLAKQPKSPALYHSSDHAFEEMVK